LDGVTHGFQLLPASASLAPAEMENYSSATGPLSKEKVEETLLEEMEAGNYLISIDKPSIVSALGAVPKPDSDDICLIHDCSLSNLVRISLMQAHPRGLESLFFVLGKMCDLNLIHLHFSEPLCLQGT